MKIYYYMLIRKFYEDKEGRLRDISSDPYDFQWGEVEWKGGNLYYDKGDYDMKIEYLK